MDDARDAEIVGGIIGVGIIGTFVRMTLANIDIAVLSEGDHHRLPQQPLAFGFIPIPSASSSRL